MKFLRCIKNLLSVLCNYSFIFFILYDRIIRQGVNKVRIITGIYKGRRLFSPKDESIRPTSDMVKESIFNMIAPDIVDAVVIDLFCGSGNLGIEALSRGASRAYFIDKSRSSIELAKKNIQHCQAENNSVILNADFATGLKLIREKVDIIFLDPPYESGLLLKAFESIQKSKVMKTDGILVLEHKKGLDLPEEINNFKRIKMKRYGGIYIEVFENQGEDKEQ